MPVIESNQEIERLNSRNQYAAFIAKRAPEVTYAWAFFVVLYWTFCVIIPCILDNDLNRSEYLMWSLGMVGAVGVYYSVKAGYAADSVKGKPVMAFTTMVMGIDWCIHAFNALDDTLTTWNGVLMFFHCVALAWATLFFYGNAFSNNDRLTGWITLGLEFLDFIFIMCVILILHDEKEGCLDDELCLFYYCVLVMQMVLWFSPIMLGFTETSKAMHIHMVVLDSLTDLPLIVIVVATNSFRIHWFMFVDVIYKILLLIGHYAYHGLYHLIILREDTNKKHQEELLAIEEAEKQRIAREKEMVDRMESAANK